jgi:hypothetical protein
MFATATRPTGMSSTRFGVGQKRRAARIEGGHVEVLAPHGVGDLVGLIVRPTSRFACKMSAYQKRIAEKDWKQRWPNLKFVGE